VTIHDSALYEKYVAGFMEAFALFEGRVLVATEDVDELPPERAGIPAAARSTWFDSIQEGGPSLLRESHGSMELTLRVRESTSLAKRRE
jgi:hypothetical protein